MSGPVEVDAVLLATAEGLQGVADGCTNSEFAIQMAKRAQGVREVHAAVAELIEADRAYDLALGALEEYYRTVAEKGYAAARMFHARELQTAYVSADTRRCKALLTLAPLPGGAE
jgi:hypothetical protein